MVFLQPAATAACAPVSAACKGFPRAPPAPPPPPPPEQTSAWCAVNSGMWPIVSCGGGLLAHAPGMLPGMLPDRL